MTFPKIIYGKCPVCGGVGTNNSNPGSAFSTEDHTGTGYNLAYYRGRLMCQMCRKQIMAREESLIMSELYNAEQKFRESMGVKKSIS